MTGPHQRRLLLLSRPLAEYPDSKQLLEGVGMASSVV